MTNRSSRAFSACLFVIALLGVLPHCAFAKNAPSPPSVSAQSAVLTEGDTGDVIYEKNADQRLPMASTTKIMTALVALEHVDPDSFFVIPKEAVGVEGSSVYLCEGDRVKVRDLLYALMLESANDAAVAIAVKVGGSVERFASMMNEKAEALGLTDTHYTNPHGLDDEDHFTTARDLAVLTGSALQNPAFSEIVSTYSEDAFEGAANGRRRLVNHNRLLRTLDGAVGVKTGFTRRAGRCLVSAVRRNGVLTVAVTLNDPNDWSDHKALHEYGQSLYTLRTLVEEGSEFIDLPVIGGEKSGVRCSSRETVSVPVPVDAKVSRRIEADRFVPAPVNEGDALAKAVYYVDGEEAASVPLYAEYGVGEAERKLSFFERILEFLGRKQK